MSTHRPHPALALAVDPNPDDVPEAEPLHLRLIVDLAMDPAEYAKALLPATWTRYASAPAAVDTLAADVSASTEHLLRTYLPGVSAVQAAYEPTPSGGPT